MKPNLALVIRAPGEVALEERPIPTPGPGEVLVRVQYTAVCGSDRKLAEGHYTAPHRYPVVMGHEWLGQVEALGEGVTDLSPGDAVTGDCSLYCGTCDMCRVNPNHCRSIEKRGITTDGACVRYLCVKRQHIYRCPGSDPVLVLAEPMSVGVNGILNRVPSDVLKRAERALILGAGGIGLLSLLTLRSAISGGISITDLDGEKLDLAGSFGLERVTACRNPDALSGGYDIVVEAAGQADTLRRAVALAGPAGHVVCLGHQGTVELDFGAAVTKSLTIHASNGSTGGFPKAMELLLRYQAQARRIITKTLSLEEAPDYLLHGIRQEKNIKVVIAP